MGENMKMIFLVSILLSLTTLASGPGTKPGILPEKKWFVCKVAKDCIVMGHGCGSGRAVNKKYSQEFSDFLGPSTIECNVPDSQTVDCKDSLCIIPDQK